MYFQFVFPSRVVLGEAPLSAYVYFPTTRRLESDRRGGRDLREEGRGGRGGGRESKGGRSRKTADYPARLGTRYCSNKIHIKIHDKYFIQKNISEQKRNIHCMEYIAQTLRECGG